MMLHSTGLLILLTAVLAALPAYAQPAKEALDKDIANPDSSEKKYNISAYYGHLERSGNGREFDSDVLSLRLLEKLSDRRNQYFTASGSTSDFEFGATRSDNSAITLGYGQIFRANFPGLIYNLGVYAGNGFSDANTAANPSDNSFTGGLNAGVAQVIPFSSKDALTVGSGLALNYVWVNSEPDNATGWNIVAFPYIQYNRVLTKELMVYARMGGTFSNDDITISGGHNNYYTPALGIDYKIDDYRLGVAYAHEIRSDHKGQLISFSVSRAF